MEIETLLNQTLHTKEIENLCTSVSFVLGKPPGPYVTYEIYNSKDDVCVSSCSSDATRWFIQVDIFTDESYMKLAKEIKKAMLKAGFETINPGICVGDDDFAYHWYSRWSIDLENDTKEILNANKKGW